LAKLLDLDISEFFERPRHALAFDDAEEA